MDIKNQKFLILGVSKSGYSVCEYLLSRNAFCYLVEELKLSSVEKSIKELTSRGAIFLEESSVDEILPEIHVLIISPGVPINHKIAVKAKSLNIRIIGELEFGFSSFYPLTVGVTGTNGKTTTVSLIDAILKSAEIDSKLVGNIGVPVTSKLNEITKDSVCVTEVSSFQLESVNSFCPHIACLLNVTPDHLERHYNMENYFFLKKRIFQNQTESEYAVLNYDDENIRQIKESIKSKVIWVSVEEKVNGAYFLDGGLYYKDELIIMKDELLLVGEHNVYNTLFAIAVCCVLKIDKNVTKEALKNFRGVPNRIELVKEKNGVKFYNDSKSTNTASTITAIKTMKDDIVLILGGLEKGETYDELFKVIKNSKVVHTVITGSSRINMLKKALEMGVNDITVTPSFDIAIKSAIKLAKENTSVLFSPACASFDLFKNYEERGKAFITAIDKELDDL